jgi:hypothetical protein
MRYWLLLLLLGMMTVAGAGCAPRKTKARPETSPGPQSSPKTASGGLPQAAPEPAGDDDPPLLLEDEPPLLLADAEEEYAPPSGPVADNSRCHVCHITYVREDISVIHARANIGCGDCHGDCDAHIADESWAWGGNGTPPEIMYPAAKINPFCMGCHPEDEIDTDQHRDFLSGIAEEKHCTHCHGDHRLACRKCKWK